MHLLGQGARLVMVFANISVESSLSTHALEISDRVERDMSFVWMESTCMIDNELRKDLGAVAGNDSSSTATITKSTLGKAVDTCRLPTGWA